MNQEKQPEQELGVADIAEIAEDVAMKAVTIRGSETVGAIPWVQIEPYKYGGHKILVCHGGENTDTIFGISNTQLRDLKSAIEQYLAQDVYP